MKYCPKCGAQLGIGVQFCACGYEITEEERKRREKEVSNLDLKKSARIPGKGIIFARSWERLIAFIVDMMFITIIGFIISLPFPITKRQTLLDLFVPDFMDLFNWIVGFSYYWLFETYNKGQTIGKKILGLRTVDANSFETTSKEKYAINNLLRGSNLLFLIDLFVGYIANYDIKGNRLRIMQNTSNTVVVKLK